MKPAKINICVLATVHNILYNASKHRVYGNFAPREENLEHTLQIMENYKPINKFIPAWHIRIYITKVSLKVSSGRNASKNKTSIPT